VQNKSHPAHDISKPAPAGRFGVEQIPKKRT